MADGLTSDLLRTAACVGLACLLVAWRDLRLPLAGLTVTLKLALPVVYFAWLSDGMGWFLDDVTYFENGRHLLELGYTPLWVLGDPSRIESLKAVVGGHHILYLWWNLLAQFLFGPHYYSPVFLNLFLTFACGFFWVRTLRIMGFSKSYLRAFLVFFLFQWDVLAWSSLINIKDTLVMTLTVLAFFMLARCSLRFSPFSLLAFGVVLLLFTFTRFYVPVLILSSVAAWLLLYWRSPTKVLILPATILTLLLVGTYFGSRHASELELFADADIPYGFFRFLLTPRPWGVSESYSFLFIPSLLHWLLFVPALASAWRLWKLLPPARLLLMYLLVTVAFYGAVPELQGPRQRIQVVFIIAWLQFDALRQLWHGALRAPVFDRPPGPERPSC